MHIGGDDGDGGVTSTMASVRGEGGGLEEEEEVVESEVRNVPAPGNE